MSKLGQSIDGFLLRFEWYRNWCAKRSRKKTDKENALTDVPEIEVYESSDGAKREDERYKKVLAARAEAEAQIKAYNDASAIVTPLAEAEAAQNQARTEEIYNEFKRLGKFKSLTDDGLKGWSQECNFMEVHERMMKERGF